jgi:hydrogenase maturation protease
MTAGTLVLGLGNEILSDDGFGPAVVAELRRRTACPAPEPPLGPAGSDEVRRGMGAGVAAPGRPDQRSDLALDSASVAGFHLLDLLRGYQRVLILDVVMTGRYAPGTILEWPQGSASGGRTLGGSHQADLSAVLALGRSMGEDLPACVTILVAEANDLLTIREELTDELKPAVPRAADLVLQWAARTGPFSSGERRDHDRARVLS